MIGPAMRDRLLSVYEVWLQQDQFGQRYAQTSPPGLNAGVRSVRQFLEELMRVSSGPNAQVQRPTALEHPDSTLLQLLGSRLVTQTGTGGPIEALARHALCLIPIPDLLAQAAGNQSPFDDDNQNRPGPQPASHDLEDDDPGCLTLDPADHATLADMLMLALKSRVGHRTIRSFFTVEVAGVEQTGPQAIRLPSRLSAWVIVISALTGMIGLRLDGYGSVAAGRPRPGRPVRGAVSRRRPPYPTSPGTAWPVPRWPDAAAPSGGGCCD